MGTQVSELLGNVLSECGFRTSNVYALSNSQNERQILRLANRSVKTLMEYPWRDLEKTGTITLTSATEYDLPTDFAGLLFDSMYPDGRLDRVSYSTDPNFWAYLKTVGGPIGATYHARFIGSKLHIQYPEAGDVIRFQYWSKYPIKSAGGTDQEKFLADSDEWLLDDDLLEMDLIWRFQKAKGLVAWQDSRIDAFRYANSLKARQRPPQGFTMSGAGEGDSYDGVPPQTNLWKT